MTHLEQDRAPEDAEADVRPDGHDGAEPVGARRWGPNVEHEAERAAHERAHEQMGGGVPNDEPCLLGPHVPARVVGECVAVRAL